MHCKGLSPGAGKAHSEPLDGHGIDTLVSSSHYHPWIKQPASTELTGASRQHSNQYIPWIKEFLQA